MTSIPSRDTDLVAEILGMHWRISEPAVRTDLGVSRATWRIGQLYWLSQSEATRSAEVIRQASLLFDLQRFLESEQLGILIPEIIPANSGHLLVTHGGYVWQLTRHLRGSHPDNSDPGTYPILTEGLVRFHAALRLFSERKGTNVPQGISARTRHNIDRLNTSPFVPFTQHPREEELLREACAWLLPRLDHFELLPRQIIHGDWTPRNVLFEYSDRDTRLVAVLDFEAMSHDPIHVDLANSCSTLLMWSGLDRIGARIADVQKMYEGFSGLHLNREHIHTAMLAHWVCHYWNWRDRLQFGEFGHEVKERLCLRIASVLHYVCRVAVDLT